MNEYLFELYCRTQKLIEDNEVVHKDHFVDSIILNMLAGWRESNELIEKTYPDIKYMYRRRMEVINSFTKEQIDHICHEIGKWYFMMKPLLKGSHNLGYMKERLKIMICGDYVDE